MITIALDTKFANQIIEKVQQYTNYNINVMNEHGIIVASMTKERIGTFHEIALRIIQSDLDEIIVEHDGDFIGAKAGINLAISYNHRKIGVIGVTGNPLEVRPIAMILRMSIETMLEYEVYKEERFRRKDLKDRFLSQVMYGENVTESELQEYADRLNLEERYVRIPMILRFNKSVEFTEKVLSDIREYHYLSAQDITSITRSNDAVIFKYFDTNVMELLQDYKFILGESISAVLRYLKSRDISYTIYVGSFQRRFIDYHTGFRHCLFLRENCREEGRSHYFYDHLNDYFCSFVPFQELHGIYEIFRRSMSDKEVENYVTVIGALAASNYNLAESSKRIHVHKNTLVYRLDKLRETFGLNPIIDQNDRKFMENLYEYLKRIGS